VVLAGTAAVLLMNRFLARAPTHITRFVEGSGLHPANLGRRFADRLHLGLGQVSDVPWVAIALVGLAVLLWIGGTNAGPVGRGLGAVRGPWREALIAMTAAGLVAFVVNDTGVAAAAPVFLYAMGVATFAALLGAGSPDRGEAGDGARRSVPGSTRR
jgi:hypothetical protein